MPIYDAHCHLQDPRLETLASACIADSASLGLSRIVVNGTSEADWERVEHLAALHDSIVPSFGLHPWFIDSRSDQWKERLLEYWQASGSHIGEIGLDRWIDHYDVEDQAHVFQWQLRQAVRMDKVCSIHCLKSFGQLHSILMEEPNLPDRGFLLHSYGGSMEMMREFVKMGAYFSISAYFAFEKKAKQQDVFRAVPLDRLLIETDSPDMLGPHTLVKYPAVDDKGNAINDPRNIGMIYDFVSELRGIGRCELEDQIARNFERLFMK